MARQFVVQLDNHPGELAHLVKVFTARGVAIHHVACVGTGPVDAAYKAIDAVIQAPNMLEEFVVHAVTEGP